MKKVLGSVVVLGFVCAVLPLVGLTSPALARTPSGYWMLSRVDVQPADDDRLTVGYGNGHGSVVFRPQKAYALDGEGNQLWFRQESKAGWIFSPRKYLAPGCRLHVKTTISTTLDGHGLHAAGFTGEPDGSPAATLAGGIVGVKFPIAEVTLRDSGTRASDDHVDIPDTTYTAGDEMVLSMSATSAVNSLGATVNHVFVWQEGPIPADDDPALEGTWDLDMGGAKATLVIRRLGQTLWGALLTPAGVEPLTDITFDEGTGDVAFRRVDADVRFVGRLVGGELQGTCSPANTVWLARRR